MGAVCVHPAPVQAGRRISSQGEGVSPAGCAIAPAQSVAFGIDSSLGVVRSCCCSIYGRCFQSSLSDTGSCVRCIPRDSARNETVRFHGRGSIFRQTSEEKVFFRV